MVVDASVIMVGSEPVTALTCVVVEIIAVVATVISHDLAIVNWIGAVDSEEVDDWIVDDYIVSVVDSEPFDL